MKIFPGDYQKNVIQMMIFFIGFLFLVSFFPGCAGKSGLTPIKIGWQVGWATQGQVSQVLKHSDILKNNGLAGEFLGFSYGAPLTEAALASQVDVAFVADQPAATLIARGGKWSIIARLIDFRSALIVPIESPIKSLKDLEGKTIAIPFGSTTHRVILNMIKEAGLVPEKNASIINLDILEQAALIQSGNRTKWGNVDAMASWDPNVAIFESRSMARVLKFDNALAVVVMANEYIANQRPGAIRFLKSFIEAYYYYAMHQEQANMWFAEEARIQFDPALLNVAAAFEPNIKAQTIGDIDVSLSEHQILMMQEGAQFAYEQKLTDLVPDMKKSTDLSLLEEALSQLKQEGQIK